jgi:hypothetical protein
MLVFSIISDSEVTLNNYKYPPGAHAIGWICVVIILAPIPAYFGLSVYKNYKNYGFTNLIAVFKFIIKFLFLTK